MDRTKEMARETKGQLKPEEKEKTDEEWSLAWSAFASSGPWLGQPLLQPTLSMTFTFLALARAPWPWGKVRGKEKEEETKAMGMERTPYLMRKLTRKLASLKSLVNRQLLVLGNKGFEATEDKVKAAAAKAKKAMEPYKEQLSNTEGWTNAQHQETLKKVTLLVESNKKEFGS